MFKDVRVPLDRVQIEMIKKDIAELVKKGSISFTKTSGTIYRSYTAYSVLLKETCTLEDLLAFVESCLLSGVGWIDCTYNRKLYKDIIDLFEHDVRSIIEDIGNNQVCLIDLHLLRYFLQGVIERKNEQQSTNL